MIFSTALAVHARSVHPGRPPERHGAQQGLHAQEAHARRHGQQLRDVAIGLCLAGDRRADPHIGQRHHVQPWQVLVLVVHQLRHHGDDVADSLREQQPVEVRGLVDQGEQVGAPLRVHSVVEHVRQRCAEHALAASMLHHECISLRVPAARHCPGDRAGAAARRAWAPIHGLATGEARVARLGIAVVAARAHLLAAFPGVERVVGPFDLAVLRHCGFHAKSP